MSKAVAKHKTRATAPARPKKAHLTRSREAKENPEMGPILGAVLFAAVLGAAGATYGAATGGGATGAVGSASQIVGWGALGGLIIGLLSPEWRDGAFAVAGVGLIADVALNLLSAAITPKTS